MSFEESRFLGVASFRKITFGRTPKFVGSKFEGGLSFKHAEFNHGVEILGNPQAKPGEMFTQAKAEEEACRVQRIAYEKEGRREDADEMLVYEMRARRRQKHGLVSFTEKLIADLPCKYGTSWKRVIGSSGLLILIFSLLYWSIPQFSDLGFMTTLGNEPVNQFWDSLYYSVVNFATVGNGNFHPTGILKLLAGLEALLGAIFIALLIVVFARKWMR